MVVTLNRLKVRLAKHPFRNGPRELLMTSQTIPVDPFDLIVFGGTGDLSERKLLPALYQRQKAGQFSEPTRIIAASRSALSDEAYRDFAAQAIRAHVGAGDVDEGELARFLARLSYLQVDAKSGDGIERLVKALEGRKAVRVFYLAVAPSLFGGIAGNLAAHGLAVAVAAFPLVDDFFGVSAGLDGGCHANLQCRVTRW